MTDYADRLATEIMNMVERESPRGIIKGKLVALIERAGLVRASFRGVPFYADLTPGWQQQIVEVDISRLPPLEVSPVPPNPDALFTRLADYFPRVGDCFVGNGEVWKGTWEVIGTDGSGDAHTFEWFVTLRNSETSTDERMSLERLRYRVRMGLLVPSGSKA